MAQTVCQKRTRNPSIIAPYATASWRGTSASIRLNGMKSCATITQNTIWRWKRNGWRHVSKTGRSPSRKRRAGLTKTNNLPRRLDHLLRRFTQRIGSLDWQAAFSKALLAQLDIRPFQAHDQRHFQVYFPNRRNHAIGDHIALHDPTEDIDED